MINKNLEKAINIQIKNEEHSSRIYMAMASWCEVNGFRGASDYLYKQSNEERFHMLKFIKYVNDRDGYALLSSLETPAAEFASLHVVFEEVLKHEEFITGSINKLYEIALNEKDYTTGNFLQWYINEQIEEESTVHAILDKMKLAGTEAGGMFLVDKDLAAMAAAKVVGTLTSAT
jgi:ferritin